MPNARELCDRWTTELRAGRPVAAEIVTDDFVGDWPGHDVHGPDELQRIIQRTRNMVPDLTFTVQIGPLSDGNFVAAAGSAKAAATTAQSRSAATTSCG